jgi:hypothetical protein
MLVVRFRLAYIRVEHHSSMDVLGQKFHSTFVEGKGVTKEANVLWGTSAGKIFASNNSDEWNCVPVMSLRNREWVVQTKHTTHHAPTKWTFTSLEKVSLNRFAKLGDGSGPDACGTGLVWSALLREDQYLGSIGISDREDRGSSLFGSE